MLKIKRDVLDYLSNGSKQRKDALEDLINLRFFDAFSEKSARQKLTQYIDRNPRDFCENGLGRFRKALLGEKAKKLVITLEVPIAEHSSLDRLGRNESSDCGAVQGLLKAVHGTSFENGTFSGRFGNAVWTHYKVVDGDVRG